MIVGSAQIRVTAETSTVSPSIRAALQKARGEFASEGSAAGSSFGREFDRGLSSSMSKTKSSLRSKGKEAQDSLVGGFESGLGTRLQQVTKKAAPDLEKSVGASIRRGVSSGTKDAQSDFARAKFEVNVDTTKARREVKKFTDSVGGSFGTSLRNLLSSNLAKEAKQAATAFSLLTARISSMGVAGATLVGTVSSLVSGLYLVGTAAASAAASVGAFGGAVAAGLQGIVSLTVATKGVGTAISKSFEDPIESAADALARLHPNARAFVNTLVGMKTRFSDFRKVVQGSFFGEFNKGFSKFLNSGLKASQPILTQTARLIGVLGAQLTKSLTGNLSRISTLLTNNNAVLRIFATANKNGVTAMSGLVSIIVGLGAALSPVTVRFATWLNTLITTSSLVTNTTKAVASLTEFFNRAGERAAQFGALFGALGSTLWTLSGAASEATNSMMTYLITAFENMSKSAKENVGSISDYFNSVGENVQSVLNLVGQLGLAFLHIGANENIKKTFDILANGADGVQGLVTSIEHIGTALAASGPELAQLAVTIGAIIDELTDSGTMDAFFDTLNGGARTVLTVLQNPAVRGFVDGAAPWLGAMHAGTVMFTLAKSASKIILGYFVKMGSVFTGIGSMIGTAVSAVRSVATGGISGAVSSLRTRAAAVPDSGSAVEGTRGTTAIITAIGRVEDAVRDCIRVLSGGKLTGTKAATSSVAASATSGLGTRAAAVPDVDGTAKKTSGLLGGLGSALSGLTGILTGVLGVVAILVPVFTALYNTNNQFKTAVDGLGQVLGGLLSSVLSALAPLLTAVGNAFASLITFITPLITGVVNFLVPGIQQFSAVLTGSLDPAVKSTGSGFSGLGGVISSLGTAFSGMIATIAPVISQMVSSLVPTLTEVGKTVTEQVIPSLIEVAKAFAGLVAAIVPVIAQLISQLLPVIAQVVSTIITALLPVFTTIVQVVAQIIAAIAPLIALIITSLLPVFMQIVNLVISAVLPVFTLIIDTVSQIIQALTPLITLIVSQLIPVFSLIITTVINALTPVLTFLIQVITAIVSAIVPVITIIAQFLIPVLTSIVTTIISFVAPVITFLVRLISAILVPAFHLISSVISFVMAVFAAQIRIGFAVFRTVWDTVLSPAINTFKAGFNGVVNFIKAVVKSIGSAWNGIKDAIKKPIEYVVKGINDWLIKPINTIGKKFGFSVPQVAVKFATGGYVGRRDFRGGGNVSGPGGPTSDKVASWLSNGEYVLDAKTVRRAGGPSRLDAMRAAIRAGKPTGGPLDGVWDTVGKAVSSVSSWIGDSAAGAVKGLLSKVLDPVLNKIPGAEFMKTMITGMFHGLTDKMSSWATKADEKRKAAAAANAASGVADYTGPAGGWTYPLARRGSWLTYGTHGRGAIDIPMPSGTPIRAASSGIVVQAGPLGTYGNVIFINHAGGKQTRYAHQTGFASGIRRGSVVKTGQVIGYVGSTGNALDVDTPVLTHNRGWTNHGSLCVGDQVYAETGEVTTITHVQHWKDRPTYAVTFSDGSVIFADENHLWAVQDAQTTSDELVVRSTKDLATAAVGRTNGTKSFSVPVTLPLVHETQDLPIDPYTLGVWLGDGYRQRARIASGMEDGQAMHDILAQTENVSSTIYDRNTWSISLAGNDMMAKLRALDVLDEKHIPDIYMHASIEQRTALLAGLMDTDGSIARAKCTAEFNQAGDNHKRLAYDTLELIRSLGMKASISESDASYNGIVTSTRYRVYFTPTMQVFRLHRKASRLQRHLDNRRVCSQKRLAKRVISSIDLVESRDTNCITVDNPTHLYLAGETLIPTHNSTGPHLHFELLPALWGTGGSGGTARGMASLGVRMAEGGTVKATPGGILAMIGEAGKNERVEPLDSNNFSERDYALIRAAVETAGSGGQPVSVRVYIGDKELNDYIDTRVEVATDTAVRKTLTGKRGM